MFSPMNDRQKNAVSIASFGGYNHTDLTQPGEWYEMKNLSGNYAPLLTPRRSRAELVWLYFANINSQILHKNGKYIYTSFFSNHNSIREKSRALFPLHVSEVTPLRPYKLFEMGNRVICLNGNDNGQLVGNALAEWKPIVDMEKSAKALNGSSSLFEPSYYYLYSATSQSQTEAYRSAVKNDTGTTVRTQSGIVPGGYDASAENFLNIGFRYCVQNDNGKYTVLNITNPLSPEQISALTTTQYYIAAADKKLYKYDALSQSSYEITTPLIAIFIRNGAKEDEGILTPDDAPPACDEGDYIHLTLGNSINLSHPIAWQKSGDEYVFKTDEMLDIRLRVLRYHAYQSYDRTKWHTEYGWQYFYIVDYNATLLEWIMQNNIIHNSEHFSVPIAGSQTVSVSNIDFGSDEVTATALNLPSSGCAKLYPSYISIAQEIPDTDCMLQHNNRLWCANNDNNEIKASAQGNWKNWDDYRGLVSDSYAVSVGSDGDFTASCVIDEYLFFFKENSYTCVYGTRPSNFCTNTVEDFIGIRAEDAESLQVIGKSAYYMGADGRVYRFNGSDSVCISQVFGDERYTEPGTVLGSAHSQDKYFLQIQKGDKKMLFVYHTATGMWFIEDADDIDKVQNIRNQAVAVMYNESLYTNSNQPETAIVLLDKWDIPETEQNTVEWECVSGLFGLESDFYQFISNLKLTYQSEVGAFIEVLVQYDEGNAWEPVFKEVSDRKQTKTAKIRVKRCAFMRLKIRGKGFSKIFRITYLKEQGSEK